MSIISIILIGIVTILLGRWMFGKWFNHVSLYSAIWSGSLTLFELQLINYYPLESETWLMIIGSWFTFIIGSITIVIARQSLQQLPQGIKNSVHTPILVPLENELQILNRLLWILNIITLLVALQHWYIVIHKFGSIANVFIMANVVRTELVHNKLPGMIPYVDPLALSTCLLAGLYTASVGKPKVVAISSLVIVILIDIASMGRAKMVLGGGLFLSGYALCTRRRSTISRTFVSKKLRNIIAIGLAVILLVFGAEAVRSYRGVYETIGGAKKSLQRVSGNYFITPSIYLYLTVSNGVLNQHLKRPQQETLWAQYSCAPLWRALSKVGFDTYVTQYPSFYSTPVLANTGTYLADFYSDFGLIGVFIIPYFLGGIASFYWFRIERKKKLVDVMILGHIMIVIIMSFLVMATQLGYWLISLCIGLIIAFFLDRRFIIAAPTIVKPIE